MTWTSLLLPIFLGQSSYQIWANLTVASGLAGGPDPWTPGPATPLVLKIETISHFKVKNLLDLSFSRFPQHARLTLIRQQQTTDNGQTSYDNTRINVRLKVELAPYRAVVWTLVSPVSFNDDTAAMKPEVRLLQLLYMEMVRSKYLSSTLPMMVYLFHVKKMSSDKEEWAWFSKSEVIVTP